MTVTDVGLLRRVEEHMGTVVTVAGTGLDDATVDHFFERIRELEAVLSRFRPESELSRLAGGALERDDVDPAIREVLTRCEDLRARTSGAFEHEPRRRSGRTDDAVLDVDAVAKGWIVEEAATVLRLHAPEFFVNAGGDVVVRRPAGCRPWRVGIQHPTDRSAVLGVLELTTGAVATSGTYERGSHIRAAGTRSLTSVTVVGPDLAEADGLATAVFASGESPPAWWSDVDPAYGLLTASAGGLRWFPPALEWGVELRP